MKMERLDKTISKNLNITRSEAKALIKNGSVFVNNTAVKEYDYKLSESDTVSVNGKEFNSDSFVYIMMNKPKGVVSASEDKKEKTVIDLLPDELKRKGLFPAGRLDKDSTGFMLITDDGAFAHGILSPKRHVEKTYIALLDKPFDSKTVKEFENGVELDGEKLLPARLKTVDGDYKKAEVVISQGIYHQIKRMFKQFGITVLELKRIKIGDLSLDESLAEGEARYITEKELLLIKQ